MVEGVLALRFSEATYLPFNHSAAAIALEGYIAQPAAYGESELDLSPLEDAVATYASAAARVEALIANSSSDESLNERISSPHI